MILTHRPRHGGFHARRTGPYHDGMRPIIGVTLDNRDNAIASGKYESPIAYARALTALGALPVMLPQELDLVHECVRRCDGLLLTGGDDPRVEPFGDVTHPMAKLIDPQRQAFETALLRALDAAPDTPALGVCLGMQMMALTHGGRLHQHLPEALGEAPAQRHRGKQRHEVVLTPRGRAMLEHAEERGEVVSSHHQAVRDAGTLEVIGSAEDGVIEAVADPGRRFYVGVQWHPELGGDGPLSRGLLALLVRAAAKTT